MEAFEDSFWALYDSDSLSANAEGTEFEICGLYVPVMLFYQSFLCRRCSYSYLICLKSFMSSCQWTICPGPQNFL